MRVLEKSYAFIDGSYDPKCRIYGWGGYLVDQKGRSHIIQGAGNDPNLAKMRNISGEVLGAKEIIALAQKLHMKNLTLYHDYEGIAAWPLCRWKTKRPLTKEYSQFTQNAMKNGLHIHFCQVKGHSGVSGNEVADQLAKLAINLFKRQ